MSAPLDHETREALEYIAHLSRQARTVREMSSAEKATYCAEWGISKRDIAATMFGRDFLISESLEQRAESAALKLMCAKHITASEVSEMLSKL